MPDTTYEIIAEDNYPRLDKFISDKIPELSRSKARVLIEQKLVTLDGRFVKPTYSLTAGQTVVVTVPPEPSEIPQPQNLPINFVYKDDHIAVINKQPDFVVHPGTGNKMGTLVNALLYHLGDLPSADQENRPGIVHRLDKNTSGLIVVARTKEALLALKKQFAERIVEKEYLAITDGIPLIKEGTINLGIGRHATKRKIMAAKAQGGREATTNYAVIDIFPKYALVLAKPLTGRTHQIRVHLKSIGTPVLCDSTYSRRNRVYAWELMKTSKNKGEEPLLARQALHAYKLSFLHPKTGKQVTYETDLPSDMQNVLDVLRSMR